VPGVFTVLSVVAMVTNVATVTATCSKFLRTSDTPALGNITAFPPVVSDRIATEFVICFHLLIYF